ncbi:sodium-dependent transporter [Candidatus Protochlamydia phocaeensis]|uniref:sodium-dependent transporter n=1 Tax=Candidatus Protochlamydia phocaeensis TaxID=1414722 RepID=UPI0009ACDD31|nr:sodium-dependent transporter [Candidatus Protochlamydia phocaeensis]
MQKQREHWGSHLGFILAAAGSAIGLGTLWKFPYVTGENGGGIFVLIYIFCTFFIGVPIFIAELVLGRKAQRGAVGVFAALANNSAAWKTVGWLGVASSFLIMSFYSVLAGWGLNYVFMSLSQFYAGMTAKEIAGVFDILASSADITLFWHFAFTALTAAVVYRGIRQGIEYWSRFMTIGLLIILVGMCIFAITLDGFWEGVNFIFYPDPARFKPSAAIEALGLSFFTLSLGQGIMLTYGSYMRRSEDIPKTAFIIGGMIIFVSLLAGLMIFPIIFTFGFAPEAGPGLVFKTLPVLFAKLPGALFISTGFFILFVFTALTSAVALIEVVAANFTDLLGWSRQKAVLVVAIACSVFGIPSALSNTHTLFANWPAIYGKTFFETIDDIVSLWFLPIGGLMVAIFTGWVLDKEISKEELNAGTTLRWIWRPWIFFIRWIGPVAIVFIILQQSGLIDIDTYFGGAKKEKTQENIPVPERTFQIKD